MSERRLAQLEASVRYITSRQNNLLRTVNGPVCYMKRSGTSSAAGLHGRSFLVTANTPTSPGWDNLLEEVGNEDGHISFSNGVFTVNTDGQYRLGAYVTTESQNQRAQIVAEIYINGVGEGDQRGASYIRSPSVYRWWCTELSPEVFNLSAGDTIEIRLYQVKATSTSYSASSYAAGGTFTIYCHEDKSRIWLERL